VALKVAIVSEALARIGHLPDAVVTAGPALDPFGFRTTLRLAVDDDGRAGFRAARSHRVVPVDRCLVAHPLLDELLHAGRFPGATEVVLRCSAATGERLAVIEPRSAARTAVLPSDVLIGPRSHLHEVVEGHRLRVSARSFFQTRPDGASALVGLVREAADGALGQGRMVDAYGGVGLFGVTVDPEAEVEVIEASKSACADARANLAGRAAVVTHGDVDRWRARPASLVVADPARTGLGRGGAAALAAAAAPRLVLVSCEPVALARDAGLLRDLGYDFRSCVVLDLFPQTPHVEVVSRFDRR
jgi:23S rRNA (uracil1939-C5)-methyltransferase